MEDTISFAIIGRQTRRIAKREILAALGYSTETSCWGFAEVASESLTVTDEPFLSWSHTSIPAAMRGARR